MELDIQKPDRFTLNYLNIRDYAWIYYTQDHSVAIGPALAVRIFSTVLIFGVSTHRYRSFKMTTIASYLTSVEYGGHICVMMRTKFSVFSYLRKPRFLSPDN